MFETEKLDSHHHKRRMIKKFINAFKVIEYFYFRSPIILCQALLLKAMLDYLK